MQPDGMPYAVEKMAVSDVPAVATLEKVVFSLPWSAHAFEYELRYNPMAHFIVVRPVAEEDSAGRARDGRRKLIPQPIVGYGGLWQILDEGHICTLAVHPEWRRRGLGELLLVNLIDLATALDAAVATLEARASNLAAQRLYRKYGFQVVGLRKGYYSDNHEDALIMTTDVLSAASFQERFQALKAALRQKLIAECLGGSTEQRAS